MKQITTICIAILLSAVQSYSQKAKEVIENGIRVGKKEMIFFRLENNVLKYQISSGEQNNPKVVPDSAIFCIPVDGVNIHMRPINPLNYIFKTEQKEISDIVSDDANAALKSIFDQLAAIAPGVGAPVSDTIARDRLIDTIEAIKNTLSVSNKERIKDIMDALKGMKYEARDLTDTTIAHQKVIIDGQVQNINSIAERIKTLITRIDEYGYPDSFTIKYIARDITEKLKEQLAKQKTRVDLIRKLWNTCDSVSTNAKSNPHSFPWTQYLGDVKVNKGKVVNYTITIKNGGFTTNKENEIVEADEKEFIVKTFRVRQFKAFVPEVAAGIAYTFFQVPKYGTDTSTSGNLIVADAGKESIRNINFSAMLNFTFFMENSPVHPLIQIGIGANTKTPSLFFGGGFRFNIDGVRRIAVSFGMAASWVKRLDKLKLGDKISGTAELEKDLKNVFNWPPKPYMGIQYNF